MSISKELLSEVLDKTVSKVYGDTNWIRHNIRNDARDDDILVLFKDGSKELISVHTVAHKCKEWLFDKYGLSIYQRYLKRNGKDKYLDDILIMKQNNRGYVRHKLFKIFSANEFNVEIAKTDRLESHEIDIRVCQWILDNKDKD